MLEATGVVEAVALLHLMAVLVVEMDRALAIQILLETLEDSPAYGLMTMDVCSEYCSCDPGIRT